jgi:lysophospholipase L1-like esterase
VRKRALLGLAGAVAAAAVVVTVLAVDDDEEEPGVQTVFLGDSITRGVSPSTRLPSAAGSWVTHAVDTPRTPWVLEANAGVFGDTLGQMRARFPVEVLEHRPEGLVILGGTNDAIRGVPVEESVDALRQMIVSADSVGIEVWVVAPPPIEPAVPALTDLVEAERELAAELGVTFVDPTAAVSDGDGGWQEGLSFDGVHPSEAGARRLAEAVVAELSAPGSG